MDHALEQFDPASEGFALIVESLEAAGLSLEAGGSNTHDADEGLGQSRGCNGT